MELENIYRAFLKSRKISTDSRNVDPGSIFFGLKGETFDGNKFAADALDKGAGLAIVDDPEIPSGDKYMHVDDALATLQELAAWHRRKVSAVTIGITGSNGKTTTKELTGAVLGSSFKTIMTPGNLNNHIGVPLTILAIGAETEFAIVEMGANHPGEIAALCRIASPDCGLITNIGKAHLEGFGSFEGVVHAKAELYEFLFKKQGLVFVNRDNELLWDLTEGIRRISYGRTPEADVHGQVREIFPTLSLTWTTGKNNALVKSSLFGEYNFENILAAVCIGTYFGVPAPGIIDAISRYVPENNRSQVIRTGRNTVIMDAYNANPSSMRAALNNFLASRLPGKMVILGDMMELGEYAGEEHLQIIRMLKEMPVEEIVLVGEIFSGLVKNEKMIAFKNTAEAGAWLAGQSFRDKTILVKGSRKMQLEKLIINL